MSNRRNREVAFAATSKIREYWSVRKHKSRFYVPKLEVHPLTHAITSNMRNGWPPLR